MLPSKERVWSVYAAPTRGTLIVDSVLDRLKSAGICIRMDQAESQSVNLLQISLNKVMRWTTFDPSSRHGTCLTWDTDTLCTPPICVARAVKDVMYVLLLSRLVKV